LDDDLFSFFENTKFEFDQFIFWFDKVLVSQIQILKIDFIDRN
jgi:hypothetical protein